MTFHSSKSITNNSSRIDSRSSFPIGSPPQIPNIIPKALTIRFHIPFTLFIRSQFKTHLISGIPESAALGQQKATKPLAIVINKVENKT